MSQMQAPSAAGINNDSVEATLRSQIQELNEKLNFANETIALMEEQKQKLTANSNVLASNVMDDEKSADEEE